MNDASGAGHGTRRCGARGSNNDRASEVGKNVIVDEILGIDSLRLSRLLQLWDHGWRLGLDLLYSMRGEYRAGIHFDCN